MHEKMCFFLLKKTSQPRKKLKFCMKKWQKNDKKRYQKEHPAPQNLIFCMKKKFFFYSKRPPTLAKNWISPTPLVSFYFSSVFFLFIFLLFLFLFLRFLFKFTLKKMKFCMKNLKSSYLWGFWKKKSRPPTSPNF